METSLRSRMNALGRSLVLDTLRREFSSKWAGGDSPVKLRIDRELPDVLKPAIKANSKLKSAYSHLDQTFQEVLGRKTLLMREKLRSKLEKATEQQRGLMETVARNNFDAENNEETFKLAEEIEQYQKQVATLERREQLLQGQTVLLTDNAREERIQVTQLKEDLKKVSRENMDLAQKCANFRLKQRKETKEREKLTQPSPLHRDFRTRSIRSSICSIREEAHRFSSLQATFFLQEMTLEQFFQSCLQASKKEFTRLQKLPRKNTGLRKSLYFRLLPGEKTIKPRSQSQIHLRTAEDMVFDTIKHIVEAAKKEARKQSISITKEEMKHLQPIEILGLVFTDSETAKAMHNCVFPANLLCLRPQSMEKQGGGGLSDRENTILMRMSSVSSTRRRPSK